ncbi:unnamed protein product [Triticum turgidum subsp. durum]|uniref:Acyl carrier protein n=1 Tax=Triticum turgidum subsp. durum TaxID=4567 RepID=A0A9R1BZJ8_TRITD|nr:unnamed protein product [Triticum turgidum subsp. durum]
MNRWTSILFIEVILLLLPITSSCCTTTYQHSLYFVCRILSATKQCRIYSCLLQFWMSFITEKFFLNMCQQAKQDTVEKVCEIVKKQLAVPEGTEVCGTTKFSDLGADSLDTVEIVMGLEEEFQISVEETSAQAIATVEDAATLIDKLVSAKSS